MTCSSLNIEHCSFFAVTNLISSMSYNLSIYLYCFELESIISCEAYLSLIFFTFHKQCGVLFRKKLETMVTVYYILNTVFYRNTVQVLIHFKFGLTWHWFQTVVRIRFLIIFFIYFRFAPSNTAMLYIQSATKLFIEL